MLLLTGLRCPCRVRSASDGGDDAGMDDAEGVDAGTSHPGLSSRAKLAALKVLQGEGEGFNVLEYEA